jgi:hypothetical protein
MTRLASQTLTPHSAQEPNLLNHLEISIGETRPLVIDLLIFATFDIRLGHRIDDGIVPFDKVSEGCLLPRDLDNFAGPASKGDVRKIR